MSVTLVKDATFSMSLSVRAIVRSIVMRVGRVHSLWWM
jgi:hypothetical protein